MRLRTWLTMGAGMGVLLAAVVGFMVVVGPERVRHVPGGLESAFSRFALYTNSLNLVRDFAFTGIGLGGTFGLIYSRYVLLIRVPYLVYAHNMFLAVWLNHGLLGIFGLVWLLIIVARLIGRGLRQGASPLFWGAALGVVVSLLHGVTDATQYDGLGWTMVPLYALLGLMVATAPRQLVAKRRFRRSWPWLSFLGALSLILLGVMWPVLSSVYQINRGGLAQARADLAPGLSEPERTRLRDEAAMRYTRALRMWPIQTMAHRRLGLLALEAEDFDTAISHLERANAGNPSHPANVKGLGYAYLWVGRLDQAEAYLQAVPGVCDELKTWAWWRGTQGQHVLAGYAQRLATPLCK